MLEMPTSDFSDANNGSELFKFIFDHEPLTKDLSEFLKILNSHPYLKDIFTADRFERHIFNEYFKLDKAALSNEQRECLLKTRIVLSGITTSAVDGFDSTTIYHYRHRQGTNLQRNMRQRLYLPLSVKEFVYLMQTGKFFHRFASPNEDSTGTFAHSDSLSKNLNSLNKAKQLISEILPPGDHFEIFFTDNIVRLGICNLLSYLKKALLFHENMTIHKLSLTRYLIPADKQAHTFSHSVYSRLTLLLEHFNIRSIYRHNDKSIVLISQTDDATNKLLLPWLKCIVRQCLVKYLGDDQGYRTLQSPNIKLSSNPSFAKREAICKQSHAPILLSQYLSNLAFFEDEQEAAIDGLVNSIDQVHIADGLSVIQFAANYALCEALAIDLENCLHNNSGNHPELGQVNSPDAEMGQEPTLCFLRMLIPRGEEDLPKKLAKDLNGMNQDPPHVLPMTLTLPDIPILPYGIINSKHGDVGYIVKIPESEAAKHVVVLAKRNAVSNLNNGLDTIHDMDELFNAIQQRLEPFNSQRLPNGKRIGPKLFSRHEISSFKTKLREMWQRANGQTLNLTTTQQMVLFITHLNTHLDDESKCDLSLVNIWQAFVTEYSDNKKTNYLSEASRDQLQEAIAKRCSTGDEWQIMDAWKFYLEMSKKLFHTKALSTIAQPSLLVQPHNECLVRFNELKYIRGVTINVNDPTSIKSGYSVQEQLKLILGRELPLYHYDVVSAQYVPLNQVLLAALPNLTIDKPPQEVLALQASHGAKMASDVINSSAPSQSTLNSSVPNLPSPNQIPVVNQIQERITLPPPLEELKTTLGRLLAVIPNNLDLRFIPSDTTLTDDFKHVVADMFENGLVRLQTIEMYENAVLLSLVIAKIFRSSSQPIKITVYDSENKPHIILHDRYPTVVEILRLDDRSNELLTTILELYSKNFIRPEFKLEELSDQAKDTAINIILASTNKPEQINFGQTTLLSSTILAMHNSNSDSSLVVNDVCFENKRISFGPNKLAFMHKMFKALHDGRQIDDEHQTVIEELVFTTHNVVKLNLFVELLEFTKPNKLTFLAYFSSKRCFTSELLNLAFAHTSVISIRNANHSQSHYDIVIDSNKRKIKLLVPKFHKGSMPTIIPTVRAILMDIDSICDYQLNVIVDLKDLDVGVKKGSSMLANYLESFKASGIKLSSRKFVCKVGTSSPSFEVPTFEITEQNFKWLKELEVQHLDLTYNKNYSIKEANVININRIIAHARLHDWHGRVDLVADKVLTMSERVSEAKKISEEINNTNAELTIFIEGLPLEEFITQAEQAYHEEQQQQEQQQVQEQLQPQLRQQAPKGQAAIFQPAPANADASTGAGRTPATKRTAETGAEPKNEYAKRHRFQ